MQTGTRKGNAPEGAGQSPIDRNKVGTRRELVPEGARSTTQNPVGFAAPSAGMPTGAVEPAG